MAALIRRIGKTASALTAGIVDLGVVFDWVQWGEEQVAAVNLVAGLVIVTIFGTESD